VTGFQDPILAGSTLIRDAIQSTNYVINTTGWAINADGTAQFFNVTIIGNDLKVLGSNGSKVELTTVTTQAELLLTPPSQVGVTIDPANIFAFAHNPGTPATTPALQVQSPDFNGNAQAAILIQGMSADTTLTPLIDFETKQLQLNGNRCWIMTHDDTFDSTGLLNLVVGAQNILGCTNTYSGLLPGAKWTATLFTDAGNGATAGVNTFGELAVNTSGGGFVTLPTQAIWRAGAVINSGSMPSRTWTGNVPLGGSLVFQATGRAVGANAVFATPNTTLHITIWE